MQHNLYVSLFLCLYVADVSLSFCIFISLSPLLFIYPSHCLSVVPSICLSLCRLIFVSLRLSVSLYLLLSGFNSINVLVIGDCQRNFRRYLFFNSISIVLPQKRIKILNFFSISLYPFCLFSPPPYKLNIFHYKSYLEK